MYYVDEQGYYVDEDGNYILNENGQYQVYMETNRKKQFMQPQPQYMDPRMQPQPQYMDPRMQPQPQYMDPPLSYTQIQYSADTGGGRLAKFAVPVIAGVGGALIGIQSRAPEIDSLKSRLNLAAANQANLTQRLTKATNVVSKQKVNIANLTASQNVLAQKLRNSQNPLMSTTGKVAAGLVGAGALTGTGIYAYRKYLARQNSKNSGNRLKSFDTRLKEYTPGKLAGKGVVASAKTLKTVLNSSAPGGTAALVPGALVGGFFGGTPMAAAAGAATASSLVYGGQQAFKWGKERLPTYEQAGDAAAAAAFGGVGAAAAVPGLALGGLKATRRFGGGVVEGLVKRSKGAIQGVFRKRASGS
jgi:hypothetical protein